MNTKVGEMSASASELPGVAERLLISDESQLYEELGIRAKAIEKDPSLAGSYDPSVTYDGAQMGLLDDVRNFGRRLFEKWEVQAYKLVCGTGLEDAKDRTALSEHFGLGSHAVAASISTLLATQLGIAPAIAMVVGVIVVKRFFRPGYEEFCSTWRKKLKPAKPASSGKRRGQAPSRQPRKKGKASPRRRRSH